MTIAHFHRLGILSCLVLVTSAIPAFGDILFTEMSIGGIVSDGVNDQTVSYTPPTSPFSNAHGCAVGAWTYQSSHSGWFDAAGGSLYSEDALQARDMGRYTFSNADGGVTLGTDEPLWVSLEADLTYDLPGNSAEALISLTIARYDFPSGEVTTLHYSYDGMVAGSGPESGSSHLSHSMMLPALTADSIYYLAYDMRLGTNEKSPATGGDLTANGAFTIAYNVVPEPTTLGLLITVVLYARRFTPVDRRRKLPE